MPRSSRTKTTSASASAQIKAFVGKFAPQNQALMRSLRRALRKRFPTAYELVYDNYNFFVIGYGPSDRPSESIISIAAAANGVGLCFIRGASLPDPKKILHGSGNQTRFLRVPSVAVLSQPAVKKLIDAAEAQSQVPFRSSGRNTVIVRSISAKQRPRR